SSGWARRAGALWAVALRAGALRVGARLRGLAWPGMGGQGWSLAQGAPGPWALSALSTLPGTQFDYRELAGDPELNAVASICLGWIADNVVEPRFQVVRHGPSAGRAGHP